MKRYRYYTFILLMFSIGFISCSDDDEPTIVVEESDPAQVKETGSTYNSLTFGWNKVEGVNQFGYTLYDESGVTVDDGVTNSTLVTFSDLRTDAPYSFELRVYGPYGEPSYKTTIKASTLPIRQLSNPNPVAKQIGNKITLSWEPVEGAASYNCYYQIGENDIVMSVTASECSIVGLAPGTHQISLEAISNYGGYTDSEMTKIEVTRTRKEVGTVEGTYTSGLIRRNNSWPCTMHVYDDGSYIIDAYYQGDGYNLDLFVDQDAETGEAYVGIYNFISYPDCEYYVMDTGRASVPQIDMIPGLTDGVYGSSFSGDAISGVITINTRYSTATGTDKFEW